MSHASMSRAAVHPMVELQLDRPAPRLAEYTRRRVAATYRYAPAPVLRTQVRVRRSHDPALARPVVASALLTLPRLTVRAEASGATELEAVDRLHHRLAARLAHRAQRSINSWEAQRSRAEHRTGPRPPAEFPEPVRGVPLDLDPITVDQAAEDLEAMQYEFTLFTERGSGQPSVLCRGRHGPVLLQLEPSPTRVAPHRLAVRVAPAPAPRLTLQQALQRLEGGGEDFVFFVDADDGHAGVVFQRYDDAAGLIRLAGAPS